MSTGKTEERSMFYVSDDTINSTATRARNLRLRYAAQATSVWQELRNYPKKFDVTAAMETIQSLRSEEWKLVLPEELLATESEVRRMIDDVRDIANSLSGSSVTMASLMVETTVPMGYLKKTSNNIHRRVLRNYTEESAQI